MDDKEAREWIFYASEDLAVRTGNSMRSRISEFGYRISEIIDFVPPTTDESDK